MRTSMESAQSTFLPGAINTFPGLWAQATMVGCPIGTSVAPVVSIPESQGFALLKTTNFQGVGWWYGSAGVATNSLRIDLYDNNPTANQPRNFLKNVGIFANGAGTGSKGLTFAPALVLPPGIYWIVYVCQGTSSMPTILNGTGASPFIPNDGNNFNTDYARYTHPAVASGQPPSPMSPPDTQAANGRRFFIFTT